MKKLWEKNYKLDKIVEAFETKDDLLLDQKLVEADILGSVAHAMMLEKIGILTKKELEKIKKGLLEILDLNKNKKFKISFGEEDIHTKIENYLTLKYGEVGQKIHTGRSRNDQVLTDIRIFTKQELLLIQEELIIFIESFLIFARKYEFMIMPGYTHMQKAMPSSLGLWAGSFAESLMDDLKSVKLGYNLNNQSPLGSAAGYGVPVKLDRQYTSDLLGFEKVQSNSLYCQNSRGKTEASVLSGLISVLQTINKLASDVLLFTTSEYNYFTVSDKFCSGSSIMPQKRNIDIAELLRGKVHIVLGNYAQIVSLSSNLISGYNRDLQDTKKPLIESLDITLRGLKIANLLINGILPNEEIMKKALTPEIFATHKVMEMVNDGVPFREAYRFVAKKDGVPKNMNYREMIRMARHLGGTGNLGLKKLSGKIIKERKLQKTEMEKFEKVINNLMKMPV